MANSGSPVQSTFSTPNQLEESQNTSKCKKKQLANKSKWGGQSSGTQKSYTLRKKEVVNPTTNVEDDFIVSDEEFSNDEDEDFEEDKVDEDIQSSDENEETDDVADGSDEDSRDEMLSECPDDSSDGETAVEREADQGNPLRGVTGKLFIGNVVPGFQFEQNMMFRDINHVREVLEEYECLGGYVLCSVKNDKLRVTVSCGGKDCEWRVHISKLPDNRSFKVKTLKEPHSCIRDPSKSKLTPKWIAKVLQDEFRAQPNMSWTVVDEMLRTRFGVQAKQSTIYKAKKCARIQNDGTLEEAYAKLHGYAEVLTRLDPGTVVKFKFAERTDFSEEPTFQRMFFAFAATIQGFLEGCRPFFGIDGTFLKDNGDGILLTAVALDGNKGTYPFAFCIVECENTESWTWFLENIKDCIGSNNKGVPYTIMSDKQKGLIRAVEDVFPSSFSRFCTRHLYANLKKDIPGLDIKEIFWSCTRATNQYEFECAMQWMQKTSAEAYAWLMEKPQIQWSRHAYDTSSKSEHRTNNMTESFNSELRLIRRMDPLKLVNELRRQLMGRFHKRWAKGSEHMDAKVTQNCKSRLVKISNEAGTMRLIPGREEKYEVVEGPNTFAVDLNDKSCSCNWWAISGLPCKHAVRALLHNRADLEDYCSEYYSMKTYIAAYHGIIHPLPTSALCSAPRTTIIKPPPKRRLPGRPKVHRKRGEDEPATQQRSYTVRCSKCGKTGHNARSCANITDASKKKKTKKALSASTTTGARKKKREVPSNEGESRKKSK